MIKKILVVSIAALCCLLIGLVVLFFYVNISVNKKNSILSYIPSHTQFILRIKKTSETNNNFFSNQIVSDFFDLVELKSAWLSIDSITSRNYTTSEVLLKNTSYICIDSANQYLILVDLNTKTNEHFIDQFLVNSTSLRKIEKYKEGYKAFFPQEDKPIYYFVKQNVFAVSSSKDFIHASIVHGEMEKPEDVFFQWNQQSQASLSFWSTKGTETKFIKGPGSIIFVTDWHSKLIISNSAEINFDESSIRINSTLLLDTSESKFSMFSSQAIESVGYFYQSDSGTWENEFYQLQIKDSLQNFQQASFTYSEFIDSGNVQMALLNSRSSVLITAFQTLLKDTSVQIIPMADDHIQQIAVFDLPLFKKIIPLVPFKSDTAKLFANIHNGVLFIANSTEAILSHAADFPTDHFIKKKLDGVPVRYNSAMIKIKQSSYFIQYSYRFVTPNTISFTSQIKLASTN